MRRLLALAALLLLAPTAHAAESGFLAAVTQGDSEMNLDLRATSRLKVGYLDANGNGRPDVQPDEPLYLDLDASDSVTYGDLRLSAFDRYAAGTVVNLTNRDAGRTLAIASGAWFAQGSAGWLLDTDNSASVTVGDVAFAAAPAKVMPGDARLGQSLTRPPNGPSNYGWTYPGARDPAKPFYVDMDGFGTASGRVTVGDLRVAPLGLAPDNAPSRAEFEQLKADLAKAKEQQAQQQTQVQETTSSSPAAWRALDWFVVGLAILNVAGLVVIAQRVNQLRGPPKNPFK